jgi:phage shock protein PspC (stress-responsive transcriptional regulator)
LKSKKLYKTKKGAMIGGVLQGFAEVYELDPSLVRIVYVLLTLFIIGSPIILYLILYLVLPNKEDVLKKDDPYDIDSDFYD